MLQNLFKKTTYEPFRRPNAVRSAEVVGPAPATCAPGTEIVYSAQAVAHFQWQHASLQQNLEVIEACAMGGEFDYAQRALKSFRRMLTTHLLEEKVKMYTYLTKCLAHDSDSARSVMAMQSEMDEAGAMAMRFASEYVADGPTASTQQRFLTELQGVRTTLADRIDWEEGSLYNLYLPPEAYR